MSLATGCIEGKGLGKWNRTIAWKGRSSQPWDSGAGISGKRVMELEEENLIFGTWVVEGFIWQLAYVNL